ncbi:TrkH family potassium uptake protein [Candidatus Neomarinimicrobiota bacterium]
MINLRGIVNTIAILIAALGLSMSFSLGWALYYGDGDALAILESILICEIIGWPGWYFTRGARDLSLRNAFLIVTAGWLMVAALGALPYLLSGAIPNITDAFFESISGFTTTGSSILGNPQTLSNLPNGIESLPHGVLFWRSFTHWIGGMGVVMFGLALLPMIGAGGVQLYRAEVAGPLPTKLSARVSATAKALATVYLTLTAGLVVLLVLGGMSIFEALCHSFGCIATGGFSTRNASIGAYGSGYFEWVIIIFMMLSATNFSLHFRFLGGKKLEYLKDREFKFFLAITFVAAGLIFFDDAIRGLGFNLSTLRKSVFTTVSLITTTGYVNANYETWSNFARTILFFLLFAGGCAGSTAGGLKLFRTMVVVKYIAHEVRKLTHPKGIFVLRIGGRAVPDDIIRNTLGFYLFYLAIFATTAIILSATGLDIESAFSASATTLGGVGPGLHSIGPMENFAHLAPVAKWVLCGNMILGRLEIFTVIVIFSRTYWKRF